MSVEIEKRSYGPESTPEEIEAIRNRVFIHMDDIIVYREMPHPSAFSWDLIFAKLDELAGNFETFSLIIDLSEPKRPSAADRAYVSTSFRRLQERMRHVALFTGKNFLLNVAAKFVMSSMGLANSTICSTFDQALEAVRDEK